MNNQAQESPPAANNHTRRHHTPGNDGINHLNGALHETERSPVRRWIAFVRPSTMSAWRPSGVQRWDHGDLVDAVTSRRP